MATAMIERPTLSPASRCYEVLVPYHDEQEARRLGLENDARFSIVFAIWAPDTAKACEFARERFREHRVRAPRARIASGGPVALRVAPAPRQEWSIRF